MTNCKLVVNGKSYGGFKNISIRQSVEAISSVYSFDFSNMWDASQEAWPLNPQDLVQIELHGVSIIRGYIDVLKGSLDSGTVSYTIEGRDKTSDLVDCSCFPKGYESIGLLALCQSIVSQFPVSFTVSGGVDPNQKVSSINADFGETVFEVLDKISSKAGVLFVPDGKGDLVITQRGSEKAAAKLIEGVNAKNFSFTKDYSERYSDYTVQGSNGKSKSVAKASGWFLPAAGSTSATKSVPRSDVQDLGVTRFRPLSVKQSGGASNSLTVKNRAEWEANVRAAKSLEITCTIQGWEQEPGLGRLWRINEMVQVTAPKLGIGNAYGDEYLLSEIEYKLSDSGGEETLVKLLPKEAFLPSVRVDKAKKDEKGAGWFSSHSNDIQVYPGAQSTQRKDAH